mgnify:CR=1 FL=1
MHAPELMAITKAKEADQGARMAKKKLVELLRRKALDKARAERAARKRRMQRCDSSDSSSSESDSDDRWDWVVVGV